MPTRSTFRGLYVLTPPDLSAPLLLERLEQALDGGASIVQYRRKSKASESEARAVQALCRAHSVPLIVNDDPMLARRIGADGVHLGKHDATYEEARNLLGAHCIIGVSCYDGLERAVRAQRQGADYVAFGRFFGSHTKPDAVQADPQLLRRARQNVQLPIAAIGGIKPDNAALLLAQGADCLAVTAAVFDADDPYEAAKEFMNLFPECRQSTALESHL